MKIKKYRNRKPNLVELDDSIGYMTLRVKTKSQARDLIQKELDLMAKEYKTEYNPVEIKRIQKVRYYTCMKCHYHNVEEQQCWECGELCGTNGRETFVYYF